MLLNIYFVGWFISLIAVLVVIAMEIANNKKDFNNRGDILFFIVVLPFLSWILILLIILVAYFEDKKD